MRFLSLWCAGCFYFDSSSSLGALLVPIDFHWSLREWCLRFCLRAVLSQFCICYASECVLILVARSVDPSNAFILFVANFQIFTDISRNYSERSFFYVMICSVVWRFSRGWAQAPLVDSNISSPSFAPVFTGAFFLFWWDLCVFHQASRARHVVLPIGLFMIWSGLNPIYADRRSYNWVRDVLVFAQWHL